MVDDIPWRKLDRSFRMNRTRLPLLRRLEFEW